MHNRRPNCHFQEFDAEPRRPGSSTSTLPGGPPPSYRSSTNADDCSTFSSTESSSAAATIASIKRRNSWTNLMESDETLYRKDFPCCTPSCTTTSTHTTAAISAPQCTPITKNDCALLEKYNLNGRYAKYFTPFYLLNSNGDPIAVSKFELTRCGSLCKLNGANAPARILLKRDRLDDLRQWYQEPRNKFCSFVLLLLIIASCMTTAVLFSHNQFKELRMFSWLPPLAFVNEQKNPTIVRMYQNDHQVRFEIIGNLPFKNDYIAVYDFKTRKMAVIDSTLKNNGINLVCFVMKMNISTMPDRYALEIGAQNAFKRKEQTKGWEEAWNFVPGSYFGNTSTLFDPSIPECERARWILLNYTKDDQRGQKCSDCYDFCLPELGLERDRLRAETFLNIVRRDCFYLFVPEWRSFAAAYSGEQNQRDFEQFYHGNRNHDTGNSNSNGYNGGVLGNGFNTIQNTIDGIVQPITDQYRNFESKWISLQQIPQKVSNVTNQMSDTASNVKNSLSLVAQNLFRNDDYQQRNENVNGYHGNVSPNGYNNFHFNNDNNAQNGNGNGNGGLLRANEHLKALLPMPPPSYPSQSKQHSPSSSADLSSGYPGALQTYPNNAQQQNEAFAHSNANGQFMLPNDYGAQRNSYNSQMPNGQQSPILLPNTMRLDSNQLSQSIYDQSMINTPTYGSITGQSNYYTPKPERGDGVSQQQSTDDQGWITVS